MSKTYVTRCIVKKGGKVYQKGDVISDLTEEEVKKGLAQNWLICVGNNPATNEEDSNKSGKTIDRMNKAGQA